MSTAVLAAASTTLGQVTSFTSQSAFETYMQDGGHTLLDVEEFEDFALGDLESTYHDAVSLDATGLIAPGLVLSANLTGSFVVDISRGTDLVSVNGPVAFFGWPTSTFTCYDGSTDLLFGELTVSSDVATMNFDGGRTGVGFRLISGSTRETHIVRVFGTDGTTLLAELMGAPSGNYPFPFFGVASDVPIGRINIQDTFSFDENLDDIHMWVAGGGCASDLDGNSMVDVFDLLTYLNLWFGADPGAELTGDDPASIDVFDLLAYLDGWFAGC